MASTTETKYQLIFYVPTTHTQQCTTAIFKTGAGTWPDNTYGETCFITRGTAQFRPLAGANPIIGSVGDLEKVEEDKVEMVVMGRKTVIEAVEALKESHPYEVVAYFVVATEDV